MLFVVPTYACHPCDGRRFGLRLAKATGATVIATSSSDEKLKIAKKLGATHTINHKTHPNWDEEVRKVVSPMSTASLFALQGTDGTPKAAHDLILKAAILREITVGSVASFKDMIRFTEANPEQTHPVVDKVFSFDEGKDAYAYLRSQKHVGKVMIKVA